MQINEVINNENVDFEGIESPYFLIGLISAFENRFQAFADKVMQEISWKQFFAIICINMCKDKPTIKELSDILGSSHQNVKQILNKLEQKGFVRIISDDSDKRKQRVELTEYCIDFCERNDEESENIMNAMFNNISIENIKTTIETIIQIESNLKTIEATLENKGE